MSRPDGTPGHGLDRDAHLLAALRHAPDRDAGPPPAVSAAILARAREQARRAAGPRAWLGMLDAWRMPAHWAAAFGSMAVAVIVGVMWSVNDPAPTAPASPAAENRATLPVPPTPGPSAPVTSTVSPPAASPVPSPAGPRPQAPRDAPARAAASTLDAPARGPEPAPAAVAGSSAVLATAPIPTPAPAAAPAAAPTPTPAPTLAQASGPVSSGVTAPANAPAMALAPSRARAAVPPSAEAAAAERSDTMTALRQSVEPLASAERRALLSRPDPLVRLAARLDAAGDAAVWRHEGRSVPHGAAARAWWSGMLDATRGRWARQAAAPDAAPWLELALPDGRDGAAVATLWLEPGDTPALVLRVDGAVWRVPLASSLPASWQQSVSAW